ncbi:MAG: hypothetical protein LBR60_01290 [Fibrobacter sp.]|jgi:hypothetical protein|nr:hypothetical protein [Fibrobacter sp.]
MTKKLIVLASILTSLLFLSACGAKGGIAGGSVNSGIIEVPDTEEPEYNEE